MNKKAFIQPKIKGQISDLVAVKKSPVHGVGIFAKEDIAAGTFIHYTHITTKEYGWINIHPNNLANHSKVNRNCESVMSKDQENIKEIVTTTDIKAGEELFLDYSEDTDEGFEQPQEEWK